MSNAHAESFLAAYYGLDTVYDFRAMHDRDRSQPARTWRGTFAQCEAAMTELNQSGHWGIHVVINEMDGVGLSVPNVVRCRAQLLDLDKADAQQQLGRVLSCPTPPHIVVNTSHNRFQLWWKVIPHADRQLYTDNQRRLIGAYNGDVQFIDAAHTARLPGFLHHKAAPTLVTVAAGPLWGGRLYDPWEIAAPLLHVELSGAASSDRQPLGHAPWSALSLDWLAFALSRIDPNSLGRDEWIAITAAVKQAGWNYGEAPTRAIWDAWCARYGRNDNAENNKQWRSISDTSAGWNAVVKRAGIQGDILAAGMPASALGIIPERLAGSLQSEMPVRMASETVSALPTQPAGPFLTPAEQQTYFAGCYWVTSVGRILGPNGRLMDANRFNGTYGGKMFMLDNNGQRTTDEPWKAALRGQDFRVVAVDQLRFIPSQPYGAIMRDEFGLPGVNTYRVPISTARKGDITPFMTHLSKLFPSESDRAVLLAYLAQCVQRPGVKVGWAVVIQSMEGAGKTIFKTILETALGPAYVYGPNARELSEGGGKFNGWMRNRLMIIVDEIRTDEKRDLIEVLKPFITEYRIEIQNKGQDQEMADNPTNWLFFTNYKDAIPINQSSRRYAILYSVIQSAADLAMNGMNGSYFTDLYNWLNSDGAAHVVDYLLSYPIPVELDAKQQGTRAPATSSTEEAIALSRGWLEQLIEEAVQGERQGFRNGWVSTVAVSNMLRETGQRVPGPRSISNALQNLGYYNHGKATRAFAQEFSPTQTRLYNLSASADVGQYARMQGYEP